MSMAGFRQVSAGSTPFSFDSIERYLSLSGNNIKVHDCVGGLFKRLCIYNAPALVDNFACALQALLTISRIPHTVIIKGGIVRIPWLLLSAARQASSAH